MDASASETQSSILRAPHPAPPPPLFPPSHPDLHNSLENKSEALTKHSTRAEQEAEQEQEGYSFLLFHGNQETVWRLSDLEGGAKELECRLRGPRGVSGDADVAYEVEGPEGQLAHPGTASGRPIPNPCRWPWPIPRNGAPWRNSEWPRGGLVEAGWAADRQPCSLEEGVVSSEGQKAEVDVEAELKAEATVREHASSCILPPGDPRAKEEASVREEEHSADPSECPIEEPNAENPGTVEGRDGSSGLAH